MNDTATLMEATEARRRVARIREGLDDIRDEVLALWRGQGWLALGYPTWAEMCQEEFPFRLALQHRDERRELVGELTDAGMSTRAIGSALGVHHDTVADDRRAVGNPTAAIPPEHAEAYTQSTNGRIEHVQQERRITGLDGKEYSRPLPPVPSVKSDEQRHAEDIAHGLALGLNLLMAIDRQARRQEWVAAWKIGYEGASPNQRDNVNPATMRAIGNGLLALAEEWTA